jgi:hypothetical protein
MRSSLVIPENKVNQKEMIRALENGFLRRRFAENRGGQDKKKKRDQTTRLNPSLNTLPPNAG